MFADWPRKPLQEELFGIHMAGEIFFRNLEQLIGPQRIRPTWRICWRSTIFACCSVIGGRYSIGGKGELQAITSATGERIQRIRGASYDPFMEVLNEPEIIEHDRRSLGEEASDHRAGVLRVDGGDCS